MSIFSTHGWTLSLTATSKAASSRIRRLIASPRKAAEQITNAINTSFCGEKSGRMINTLTRKEEVKSSSALTSKIIRLLKKGDKRKAINLFYSEKSKLYSSESRFLNGLNCADKNDRKRLWIASFQSTNHPTVRRSVEGKFTPFQYWSQGELPEKHKFIYDKWNEVLRKAGQPAIQLFNKKKAREWITSYVPELQTQFDNAPIYAIEADIFRIAFALKNNCIWIDSDQYPKKLTPQLIKWWATECDTLLMFRWNRPWVTNSFFMTKKDAPLFRDIVDACQTHAFTKQAKLTKKDVLNSFGPGRYNILLENIIKKAKPDHMRPVNINACKPILKTICGWRIGFSNEEILSSLKPPFCLPYNSSNQSWHSLVE